MQQEQLLVRLNIVLESQGLHVRCWSRNFIQNMSSDLGGFFFKTGSVCNSSESETALFCAKRRQKAPQIFFPKSATNFGQRRHIWSWKWPAMPFLFQFYVTIFPRETKNWKIFQNIKFFKIFPLNKNKILFFLPAPEFFWRHMEVQNSHFGAKPPLLHTLNRTAKICRYESWFTVNSCLAGNSFGRVSQYGNETKKIPNLKSLLPSVTCSLAQCF